MKYSNINPNRLLDEFTQANITTVNGIISYNLNLETMIAESVECEFVENTDMSKVNEVVANHNPNVQEIKKPSTEELLIKEIANLKVEIMSLKGGNA
jgi:hypothetical protein